MRILDQNGTEITNPDLDKGHLEIEQIVKAHHDAVESSPGKSHMEVLREYPNGGKDMVTIWDEEPVEARDAYDEYEQIQRYIIYTDDELKQIEADKEAQRQQELIPTNGDLSDAMIDLAQAVSDNGDGLAEIGELISSMEERISKLEGAN